MDLSKVSVNLPFPKVEPANEPEEAKKLMNDYSGREGELTAVCQYSFHSYILAEKFPEISETLLLIAVTEMEHHEQLGKTIFKLGGYPVLGGANYPWSGSFVNYAGDLRKILEINIRGEELAIYNYEKTILRLTNHQVIKLLERIILDEELHIKIFSDLLAELD